MSTEKKEVVIITNNTAHIIQAQIFHGPNGLLQLNPFSNEVEKALWEQAKKLRQVQVWLETLTDSKEPEVHGRMMLEEGMGIPALDEVGADRVLRNTIDKKLLAKWLKDEQRGAIRVAIQRRQTEIEEIETQAITEAKAKARGEKGITT